MKFSILHEQIIHGPIIIEANGSSYELNRENLLNEGIIDDITMGIKKLLTGKLPVLAAELKNTKDTKKRAAIIQQLLTLQNSIEDKNKREELMKILAPVLALEKLDPTGKMRDVPVRLRNPKHDVERTFSKATA